MDDMQYCVQAAKEMKGKIDGFISEHGEKWKQMDARLLDVEQKGNRGKLGNVHLPVGSGRAPSLGEQFTETDEFKSGAFKDLLKSRGSLAVELKYTTSTGSSVDTTPAGPLAPPDRSIYPDELRVGPIKVGY
jgi:hypothetical protein